MLVNIIIYGNQIFALTDSVDTDISYREIIQLLIDNAKY